MGDPKWILFYWFSVTATAEQNLALHKPAWQSGTSDSLAASRAVDGRYGGEDGDQRYCADPYNRPKADGRTAPAEWWVDLQDNYTVDHVTLYNTYQSYSSWRLERFVISVGVTEDVRSDCGEPYNDPVEPGGHVTIPCGLQGRFVHFRKVGGFDAFYVVLCEVEVYGGKIMQHESSSRPNIKVTEATDSMTSPVMSQASQTQQPRSVWTNNLDEQISFAKTLVGISWWMLGFVMIIVLVIMIGAIIRIQRKLAHRKSGNIHHDEEFVQTQPIVDQSELEIQYQARLTDTTSTTHLPLSRVTQFSMENNTIEVDNDRKMNNDNILHERESNATRYQDGSIFDYNRYNDLESTETSGTYESIVVTRSGTIEVLASPDLSQTNVKLPM